MNIPTHLAIAVALMFCVDNRFGRKPPAELTIFFIDRF